MRARSCQARLSLPIVAIVAHVFRVMAHILMVANEKLTHPLGVLLDFLQTFMTVLKVKGLQLESPNGIGIEFLDLLPRYLVRLHKAIRLSLADFTNLVKPVYGR